MKESFRVEATQTLYLRGGSLCNELNIFMFMFIHQACKSIKWATLVAKPQPMPSSIHESMMDEVEASTFPLARLCANVGDSKIGQAMSFLRRSTLLSGERPVAGDNDREIRSNNIN